MTLYMERSFSEEDLGGDEAKIVLFGDEEEIEGILVGSHIYWSFTE